LLEKTKKNLELIGLIDELAGPTPEKPHLTLVRTPDDDD
jgi:hypothetical protein